MQDLPRQLSELGPELADAQLSKLREPPSGSIRVKLATDRAGVASRLARILGDAGHFDVLPCAGLEQAAEGRPTAQQPIVLVLDCANFAVQQRNWLQRKAGSQYPARVLWFLDAAPNGHETANSVLDAVKLGWCHGFITSDCPPATILRAIIAVAGHDFWLPRAMLARAFSESQALRAGSVTSVGAQHESDRALARLTLRERQILHLVRRGLTNKEVGRHLGIEEDTVKKHLRNMYAKLGVHRRAQMLLRSVGEARASG
ncbi:MAG: LuxR C-terminal-related transcriptional regulator [Steroidobacteraceae bacterium]